MQSFVLFYATFLGTTAYAFVLSALVCMWNFPNEAATLRWKPVIFLDATNIISNVASGMGAIPVDSVRWLSGHPVQAVIFVGGVIWYIFVPDYALLEAADEIYRNGVRLVLRSQGFQGLWLVRFIYDTFQPILNYFFVMTWEIVYNTWTVLDACGRGGAVVTSILGSIPTAIGKLGVAFVGMFSRETLSVYSNWLVNPLDLVPMITALQTGIFGTINSSLDCLCGDLQPSFTAVMHVPQLPARQPKSISTSFSSAKSRIDPAAEVHSAVLLLFAKFIVKPSALFSPAPSVPVLTSASCFFLTVAGPKAS